ncbi:MAG: type II toxin-antitoxin system RelB/DinJ family antitoxin [Candidatus Ancillula sp.]|jgi:addiction module RelB/DinJ family antitoxin|nr:type II toxin-antitoxin system RelB/DinJ family antitoxin [Candidatus Ancillula sp.]
MQTATIATRVTPEVKRKVNNVVESYRLDISSVMRAFAMQIIRTKSIPLDLAPQTTYSPEFIAQVQAWKSKLKKNSRHVKINNHSNDRYIFSIYNVSFTMI